MIILFFLAGAVLLLGLIYLLSLTPPNTICPQCKKRKKPREYGWKMNCNRCEGETDD